MSQTIRTSQTMRDLLWLPTAARLDDEPAPFRPNRAQRRAATRARRRSGRPQRRK